ncbi:uncharacterized protein LOC124141844 isoform X1 [Haliotis rufescens]|uniref:uncharacterized protein LOC124141844 isoform X1 n=2 Tax=Haliotis rufescens TaxID=6454 RepID=UPI00201F62DC|nr:uncharacterized protein LOC124141844 isoform X1 [Haliotis rufescens]
METGSWPNRAAMSVQCSIMLLVCTFAVWDLSTGLQENAENVETITTYRSSRYTVKCGFWKWGRCTRYRRRTDKRFECKTGYKTTDDRSCPHSICDNQINPDACNIDYRTSHIVYNNGRTQYKSGGSCTSPGICTNCYEGFFPSNERCRICTAISNCDLETCTSSSNQVCSRCEGFVSEQAGHRAYVASSDRRSCIQACSWRSDSTWCYPGTCRNEYASNCACSSGFTGRHCQTITAKPTINSNLLRLTASNGDVAEAPPNINSGPSQSTSWSNINSPSSMYYKFTAAYRTVPPAGHRFIEGFRVGIVSASATFKLKTGGGVVSTKVVTCGGVSRSSPDTDLYTCEGTSPGASVLPLPFQHRDAIEFSYATSNGGYVNVRNKETKTLATHYYSGATQTHTFTMTIDLVEPYHCTGSTACVGSMLTAPNAIKSPTVNLRWSGWVDDDAGVDHFVREVYELHAVGDELRDKRRVDTTTLTSSSTANNYTLTTAGVYSVVLSAYDKAGNHRSARRILIYDSSSIVTTQSNKQLRVTTASSATSEWQTTSSAVTVDWTNRYINTVHHSNKWLHGVASSGGVGSDYDDNEGVRSVAAINNVQGVTRFLSSYKVDHKGGWSITSPPVNKEFVSQGLSQSQTITPSLADGDTVRFWIRAYDIKSDLKEENVTVHIDTSPPVIENLWLTRGDRLNISVHSVEEFTEMTMEWVAYDEHSGLEAVSWRIVDKYRGRDIVHGVQHITAQGNTSSVSDCKNTYAGAARGANCYCTPAKGCYHRHFQVKPTIVDRSLSHGGIFSDKSKGSHDSDYHLEVTVTNHAKLTTKMEFKVTIDASPPNPGTVHDGHSGNPEVDYQHNLEFHAHWDGFFDTESGVKFYQYRFSPNCFQESDFGLNKSSLEVTETYSTSASWTAPSVGKYHVTVVAYNRALEASDPVCSDGVTVDTTPPSVSEVAVRDSRVVEGLVKSSAGDVWLIDTHRRRTLIVTLNKSCSAKATPVDDGKLSLFPIHRYNNGSGMQLYNTDCESLPALPATFINSLYVYREHHLFVNWTGSDTESGIYDYELGLMSDPSGEAAPDILPYTSTHHHPQYQGYHPRLSEGQQFYIAIKAINKAGASTIRVVGPVIVHTTYPLFSGSMTMTLRHNYLIARWPVTAFTDTEYLQYEVAVGSKDGQSTLIPFTALQSGGGCTLTSPPTCTAVALTDLHWDLHHSHTYFVSVRVTNIVGLSTVAVSEPYVHDVMLPLRGVVEDVIPVGEESLFEINGMDDTDYQISTQTLRARWYGFDNGITAITYKLGIGSQPFATDIQEHVDVGNTTFHSFTGLGLHEKKKYFVTVVAAGGGGEMTVSSDGVTIIRPDVDVTDVTVRDGPGCGDSVTVALRSAVNQTNCSRDDIYQVSTSTYAARWNGSNWLSYPDAKWSLQKKVARTEDLWDTERAFEPLGSSEMVVIGGLSLEAGNTYRAALKFCVVNVCSKTIYSDGVTVIPHPPTPGNISLTYRESVDGQAQIQVMMSRFRDPDIPVLSEAYDVMDRYEWGLTDNSHNNNMFINWQEVDEQTIFSGGIDKIKFQITLPQHLDFTKCRRVSVRGYNQAGLYTIVSADVKDCTAYDPPNIVSAIVLDVIGELKEDVGHGISLEQNSHWHDADYTPYKNILSAVWPTLRHRNYTWAVVSGDQVDPSSHYKRESLMTVTDPCSMPDVIRCGHTVNEFINVEFAELSYLKHGKRFYVCIHADEKNSRFEKWTSYLTEVNACSNGITVDLTPPTPGTVKVENLTEGTFQVSRTEVAIRWTRFTDVEEDSFSAHTTGIAYYEVAIGTISGGQDVVTHTIVGSVNKYILHRLNLQTGSTHYASVRATDFVNKTTVAVSGAFLVDSTPPALTGQHIQVEERYITSHLIHVCWNNVFSDEESGTEAYTVAMGTRHAYADVSEYITTDQECLDINTLNKIEDGHSYYITVKAFNGAGLYTMSSSRPLVVDTTPPSTGHVFDGVQSAATPGDKDKDYITSVSEMGAYWEGFDDPHSSVATYTVKVGTCAGCDDTMNESKTGLKQYISLQHILLSPGVKYFTTVTACNTAGLCSSSSTSDGVILDSSPPVTGTVQDGTGDVDIQFQAARTFIGCKWRGFSDPESGLDHYEWLVGTEPGADDILAARNAALGEVIFHTIPHNQQLPVGLTLYNTVRAFNKGGLYSEATSNGVLVDDSAPIVVTRPAVKSLMSLVPNTTVSRTVLGLHWEFQDADSFMKRHYLSLSSHQLGEINSYNLEVPGLLREYTIVNLDLHDGSRYTVKVTACNMAGLCASANTNNILVDSSKPKTGTFATETDHAVKLSRHHPDWMTWNRTSLKLAWLGFSDLHSGIDHYLVSVGSQAFGTDFNTGKLPEKVFHSTTGVDRGDEGILQSFTIPTLNLPSSGSVFLAIWGVNGVGLQSDAYHAELVLEADSSLWLVRRCQAYNCEGHCVCAVQGGTCSPSKACTQHKTGGAKINITINDVVDLMSPGGSNDVDVSLFNTVMAATWSDSSRGSPVTRYEYSIGESGGSLPGGVFYTATERVWFDAGQQTSTILPLPTGRFLTSGVKYSFFVRAWYNETYIIFKSDGVLIQIAPPTVTDKTGNAVKELVHPTETKDTDFQTQNGTLFIQWSGKFLQGQSGINRYRIFISTVPGGHSIHASGDLTTTSYTATGLSLHPNTVYYSSVLAYNKAGLVSWAYSDGVQVDVLPPVTGRVKDGPDVHDLDYQRSPDEISASWYGFSDTDSSIAKYFWCVGTVNDTTDCSVMDWIDVGLHTSSRRSLSSLFVNGTRLWNKVYAVDAVGYTSDIVVSDGVVIDASPPERQALAYLGDNLVKNPSFELEDIPGNSTRCNLVIPTTWETDTTSCVKVLAPGSPLAKDGHMFVSISGRIHQRISGLETGRQYKLTLHAGYPETVSNNHRSVDAIVTIGSEVFSFTLDPNLCRGTCSVGDHSVVLWNKHTYRFTAVDTSAVLKIASSSRMMEFVLDHVSVQTVDYVAGPDSVDTEEHLVVHSVFLSHWSSLHASWHFVDQQSPITQYKWAIGTVPGGTHVQGYTDVGRETQGTLSNLQLSHGATVYITVMATNAAGLSTVTFSDAITVDMTAPQFDFISDGLDGSDEDYQTSAVVGVYWQARDEESGVEHCDWAIGRTRGSSDIKQFERVSTGQSTAQHDISSKLHTSSMTVYTTVRCFNNAGLVAAMTSDGVEVIQARNQTSVPGFSILRESQSVYSERDVCHQSQEKVRLRWDAAGSNFKTVVLLMFQIGIEGEKRTQQSVVPVHLDYTFATLSGVTLKSGSTYHVLSFPVDVLETKGETTLLNFTMHGVSPLVAASGHLSVVKTGVQLTVSWRNVFASPWDDLKYEVHVGTVLGGAEIVDRLLTEDDEMTLTLNSKYRKLDAIYVTLSAIDTCGLPTQYTQTISLN